MKTSTFILCAAMLVAGTLQTKAQMSAYDYNQPVGWANIAYSSTGNYDSHEASEVTGSGDVNPILVTNYTELRQAMNRQATPRTIYIQGEIEFSGQLSINRASNMTIYGLPGSALVNATHSEDPDDSGILRFTTCNNVIIRNVTFKGSGAYDMDGNDNLFISNNSHNIWVDHCDFQDGVDGNFDCSNGADNISVTWCRFRYLIEPWPGGSGGSDDHRFSNVWGGADNQDENIGHLNTTFYACWWDEGCRERMPRVRFGKVHLLNCLYSSSVTNYCIGAGYLSNIYAERCVYDIESAVWRNYATSGNYTDYNITVTGSIVSADDTQQRSGDNEYFIPTDYYTLEGMPVNVVYDEVRAYAGATLNVVYGEGVTTGITGVTASDAEVVATEYYSPAGIRLAQPQGGINIVRQRMSDGTVKTTKVIMK